MYRLRHTLSDTNSSVFARRDDALAALVERIVLDKWPSGHCGATVLEYQWQRHPTHAPTLCLKRRWFFRHLGSPLPAVYELLEHIRDSCDRFRFVLHCCNYSTGRTEPVYVCSEPLLNSVAWFRRYRLAHWLFNASRAELRNAAHRVGMSWHTKWLKSTSALRRKIFACAIKCNDRLAALQLPSKSTVFAFEKRNLHQRTCIMAAFVRA